MSKQPRVTYPLNLSPELHDRIMEAAEKTGLPKSEVMRMALAIGLDDLRDAGFDLVRVIRKAAAANRDGLRVEPAPGKEAGNGTEGK
jgi:predicted DNA-binding protein